MAFFQGRALWMVSVAASVIGKGRQGPFPVENWTVGMKYKADALIREVLKGVGVASTDTKEFSGITRVVRRMATDDERRMVTENYLLPAVCAVEREAGKVAI